jgi:hypothetical protein
MAVLYITEFAYTGLTAGKAPFPAVVAPSLADQTVAITASSVQSAFLNAATNIVRVTSDVTCSIKFGDNPTASAVTMRLADGAVEYIGVPVGGTMRIAVIANT